MKRACRIVFEAFNDVYGGAKSFVLTFTLALHNEFANAVHEFLRFQIADHKTGDCTAIR